MNEKDEKGTGAGGEARIERKVAEGASSRVNSFRPWTPPSRSSPLSTMDRRRLDYSAEETFDPRRLEDRFWTSHQRSTCQPTHQKELVDAGRKQLEHLLHMNILQMNPDFKMMMDGQTEVGGWQQQQQRRQTLDYQHPLAAAHFSAAVSLRDVRRSREDSGCDDGKSPFVRDDQQQQRHPLFSRGTCGWAGCEAEFGTFDKFKEHLDREHILDERSTAQTRVQVQIVSQLEQQLSRERDRLEAMMAHLHPPHPSFSDKCFVNFNVVNNNCSKADDRERQKSSSDVNNVQEYASSAANIARLENTILQGLASGAAAAAAAAAAAGGLPFPNMVAAAGTFSPAAAAAFSGLARPDLQPNQRSPKSGDRFEVNSRRLKLESQPMDDLPATRLRTGGGQLDPESDINRNRQFYRTQDVRPPFTYAALIRQGIVESTERQLTLNEIYTWFQKTFAYFRRNAATWKNAVRHNLSLHKCFMRVENVKGAVWTVDEMEYHRRRPQRGVAASGAAGKPSGLSRCESRISTEQETAPVVQYSELGKNLTMSNGLSQPTYLPGFGGAMSDGILRQSEARPSSPDVTETTAMKRELDYGTFREELRGGPRSMPECSSSELVEQQQHRAKSASPFRRHRDMLNGHDDAPEDLSNKSQEWDGCRTVERFHPYIHRVEERLSSPEL